MENKVAKIMGLVDLDDRLFDDVSEFRNFVKKSTSFKQEKRVIKRNPSELNKEQILDILKPFENEIMDCVKKNDEKDLLVKSIHDKLDNDKIIERHVNPLMSIYKGLSFGFAVNYEHIEVINLIDNILKYR